MKESLDAPIRYLKGIGPKRAQSFNAIGINTVEDLLYYFPRRYQDRSHLTTIAALKEGEIQTIKAQVLARGQKRSFYRRGMSIIEAQVGDNTGRISCVWFNQPYLADYFKPGTGLILYGKVERYGAELQMGNPEFEIVSEGEDDMGSGRIVPVYSLPSGMAQRGFRNLLKKALDEYVPRLSDCLPYDIRSQNNLLNLAQSLINIHFPQSLDLQARAYQRLAFEEFFLFQVPVALRKLKNKERRGISHNIDSELVSSFIAGLPFKLTSDQESVLGEIKSDMASPQVMQRLLQGDVGSGKTVVATIAAIIAIGGGYQVAFMVPTEVLAKQHYEKISYQATLPDRQAGKSPNQQLRIALLTGSLTKKEREKIYRQIEEGAIDLVIGTHALLEAGVKFKNLGLVVIDEQHKFGVGQRALLTRKGLYPDILIMTATPIPRTLAITIYGDLDISVIRQLPPGRQPVNTMLFSHKDKAKAYEVAKGQLRQGRQVYVVYPVIEESYALDIAGAKKMYGQLKDGEFKEFNLGLIHGRLKQQEQDEVMLKFKEGKIDLLVSTTVLEVGIDIANATCMIIESAERFGLSQLHQLRGRVGRGREESFCILVSDAESSKAGGRLEAMVKYHDGFRIAEEDLKIRGPGEFFGRRQHGLTELRIGNPLTQMQLLKKAREDAIRLIASDRGLGARQNLLLKKKLLQKFPEYEKLMVVG
ncbi:MAG: ATP-dependent DNA helicase RecG [Candidatus Omnitrophica bacterium]|nr:ATP-dependent DNA helicase RecG [Candidatus Omnitrophota bacterium]